MRISNSLHCFSSQLLGVDVWPERRIHHKIPVILDLKDLFDRIAQKVLVEEQQDEESNDRNGKKRAASPIPVDGIKKRRLSPNGVCSTTQEKYDTTSPLFPAPPIPLCPARGERQPIWNHTFSIRYKNDCDALLCRAFTESLDNLCGSFSEPTTIDIGYVQIVEFLSKLIATWKIPFIKYDQNCLALPLLDENQEHMAILRSCYELQQVGKVDILSRMKVVVQPGHLQVMEQLPFEIQLEVTVSFRLPSLFEPFPRREPKKRVRFIEECQSRLYHFLYSRSSGQDTNIPHTIDIPYFYSILTSALPIQSRLANGVLQPEALLPNLLPFQRRSVAWLLEREGKEVTTEGAIVPKTDDGEYCFWDEIQEGNHTFFFNRLSRMLSPDKPVAEKALGGILAEEPGLGKTLETIALILLNPAPADRNPSLIRWDPETRLDVKAVKVKKLVPFLFYGHLPCPVDDSYRDSQCSGRTVGRRD